MAVRKNTPPLTNKVRQAIEELIAENPGSKAKSYLTAMLEAHAQLELKRARRKEEAEGRRKCAVPKLIKHEGREQSLAAWCREKGVSYGAAHGRIQRGYSVEEALSPTSKLPSRK